MSAGPALEDEMYSPLRSTVEVVVVECEGAATSRSPI